MHFKALTATKNQKSTKNCPIFSGDIQRVFPKKFASSFSEGVTFGRVPSFPDDPKCTQDTKSFLPLPSDLSRLSGVNFLQKHTIYTQEA